MTEPRSTLHCAHNVSLNILFYDNTANTILIKTMGDTALMLFVEKNSEHKTDRNNTQWPSEMEKQMSFPEIYPEKRRRNTVHVKKSV